MFLGIEELNENDSKSQEESDEEAEVNMEAELLSALSELKKYKNKYNRLKNFVIEQRERQELEEKEIDSLISELEEIKRIEAELKERLDEKEKSCQKLEIEMVDLKRKVEVENNVHDGIKNSSIILDKIPDSPKFPFDKNGIGYKRKKNKLELGHGSSRSLKKILHSQG